MESVKICTVLLAIVGLTVAQQLITNGVSCKEKKTIVDKHNELRRTVALGNLTDQPKASNMQKLVWDNGLEAIAQKWANGMQFRHNPNPKDDRFDVGENLYISYSTDPNRDSDWSTAIQSWYDEYKLYTFKPTIYDPATGHYTQVVWANTIYVGCGFTVYSANGFTNKLYVCNYGPPGNYLGEYPYEQGSGCENLCCKTQCQQPAYGKDCI